MHLERFTINSIYSDEIIYSTLSMEKDLEKVLLSSLETQQRIKEDYLRILRYLRFLLIIQNNHIIQKLLDY